MNIPNNLLKSIAIGVTLGVSFTSCEVFDTLSDTFTSEELDTELCGEECSDTCEGHISRDGEYDCVACGMG